MTNMTMRTSAVLLTLAMAGLIGCDDDPTPMDAGTAPRRDAGPPGQPGDMAPADEDDFAGLFPGEAVTLWPPYTVERIERDPSNTLPALTFDGPPISADHYFWDFWPLRDPDGTIAVIDGRVVIIGLSAPREGNIPGERHGLARWRYFYSDGFGGWIDGGLVFPEGTPIGDRQWAGSSVYDRYTGRVDFYYTALGELEALPDGTDSPTNAADGYEDARRTGPSIVRQQIVHTSADLVSAGGISFEDFTEHEVILDADGEFYATAEQARDTGALYVFRDPWYFEDPESGFRFLLFSGAAGWQTGPKSGVVGLAYYDESTEEWIQLSPIIAAMDTNSQLERPHIVYREGRYYLFFSSHEFTFAGDDRGPEGLYGFWGENLWGHYAPLNDGGLVAANPVEAPLQLYSYMVMPGGAVLSFVNYFDLGNVTLEEIGDQTREWQREHFGGTPAEPFFLDIDGTTTTVMETRAQPLPAGVQRLVEALDDTGA